MDLMSDPDAMDELSELVFCEEDYVALRGMQKCGCRLSRYDRCTGRAASCKGLVIRRMRTTRVNTGRSCEGLVVDRSTRINFRVKTQSLSPLVSPSSALRWMTSSDSVSP